MSAEPVYYSHSGADNDAVTDDYEPVPDWVRKPGGFTVDEFFRLPNLPPHTELIDGELVFVSPHARFHMRMLRLLERVLDDAVPGHLEVIREMNVVIGDRQAPEPDLSVIPLDAVNGLRDTRYPAEVVLLAVEVESPDSELRDRERKPQLYAQGGIPHYWRVAQVDGKPVVHVYRLDPETKSYVLTGVHHERLRSSEPSTST